MKKPKYEKPTARDLSSIQIAQGSCVTGRPEYEMIDCSTTGEIALLRCVPGSTVYPGVACIPTGNSAGYSCVDGYGAG
jgi:hypothetical protein